MRDQNITRLDRTVRPLKYIKLTHEPKNVQCCTNTPLVHTKIVQSHLIGLLKRNKKKFDDLFLNTNSFFLETAL